MNSNQKHEIKRGKIISAREIRLLGCFVASVAVLEHTGTKEDLKREEDKKKKERERRQNKTKRREREKEEEEEKRKEKKQENAENGE